MQEIFFSSHRDGMLVECGTIPQRCGMAKQVTGTIPQRCGMAKQPLNQKSEIRNQKL
jgi:hypothetical protein